MNPIWRSPTILLAVLTTSCAAGPDYEPPTPVVADQFDARRGAASTPPVDVWWQTFDDPVLTRCIEQAFRSNLDLRASLTRIRAARAMRSIESSQYWPQIDTRLAYTVDWLSENNPRFQDAIKAGLFPRDVTYWDAGFDVTWELDVFGGTERRIEAAVARMEEEQFRRGALLLSVAAEVARNYLELRGHQHRLAILNAQIDNELTRIRILEHRRVTGLITANQVLRSRSKWQRLESTRPPVQAEIRASQYRLAVLMGRRPEDTLPELDVAGPLPVGTNQVPVGLPSGLLRRRPDVLAAERRLAAASAEVGVAHADFFPRFFLTGSPYLQSQNFADLFSSPSSGWVFGPSIQWNLFAGGRNQAKLDVAEAKREQAMIDYQATVNHVLEEVESSLTRYGNDAASLTFLTESMRSREQDTEIQELRHRSGITERLDVVDARAGLIEVQLDRLDQHVRLLTRLVALHKALGGGWLDAEAIAAGLDEMPADSAGDSP